MAAEVGPPWAWRFLVRSVVRFLRILFRWRIRVRVEGEVQPGGAGAVLVANHTGNLEPFLVAYAVWRATGHWMQPLAKAELFDLPVLGFLGKRAAAIPVERETADGRNVAYAAAIARLAEGGTIYIAPEGTITHDGHLLPLRHGAARLAIEAGAPVIVVTTFGGQRGFSPVVTVPHRRAVFDVVIEELELDPTEGAAELTGRIAATMLDRSVELRDAYPQAAPDEPWWPPYSEPAEPSRTGRENLEKYRETMADSVLRARERMVLLAAERDLDARYSAARDRARHAAEQARERATELSEQVRSRAEELSELAHAGELGDELRHRAEELAAQARLIAEHAATLRSELLDRRDEDATDPVEPVGDPPTDAPGPPAVAADAPAGRPPATGEADPADATRSA